VARQHRAVAAVIRGDHQTAVVELRHQHYMRKVGPVAMGSPPLGDIAAVERHRSRAFLTGIEWVLRYYIRGCPSWSWFYPAHYPPLCTSLASCADEALIPPPLHMPFPPALQLLAVLPPQSAELLPERLQELLLDSSSPVLDFYPRGFEVDLKEGDKEWQAIVLLPFVDESRLRAALAEIQGPNNTGGSVAALGAPEPARAFLVQPSNEGCLQQQKCQDHDAAAAAEAADAAHAAATAASTCVEGTVAMWDFLPDRQLPEGRPSTGCSIADKLAAVAAANAAARIEAANARSEAAVARSETTASQQNQGRRGRGRWGRGQRGRASTRTARATDACDEERPRLRPDNGELTATADDEQQPPVALQEEDANEEQPLQSAHQEMATVSDMEQLQQQLGPGDLESAARITATPGADATTSGAEP